jgi:hypothetical protein
MIWALIRGVWAALTDKTLWLTDEELKVYMHTGRWPKR